MARTLKFKEETDCTKTFPCNSKGTAEHSTQPTADFFSPNPAKSMETQTDFFKNMSLFLCYILLLFFF